MVYKVLKRTCDVFFSTIAILFFLMPWVFTAIIIKIQSPGPVVYRAKRIGINGKVFTLYKFRTMCVDSGKIHKTTLRSDSRIFPFGHFLRQSKLDETLQLFNILKGDMSIIGPRPEDEENAKKIFIGEYQDILSAKPGLSSPASLYDYTHGEKFDSEELYEENFLPTKLKLELYYVNHRGFWYDVKLVVKTVIIIAATVFGKESFKTPKELGKMQSI